MLNLPVWMRALAAAACLACTPPYASAPSESQAATVEEPTSLPFSNSSAAYAADREEARRRLSESAQSAQGDIVRAVYGVSLLMVLHEVGHEFARRNGLPRDFDEEEFADFFAVNLLMSWSDPATFAELAALIEATNVFLSHASYSTHGAENGGLARRNAFSCAFIGYNMHLMRSDLDAVGWWHEDNAWNPQFRHRSWPSSIVNIDTLLRDNSLWVEEISARHTERRRTAAAVNMLMLFRAAEQQFRGMSAETMNACGDKVGVLRRFLVTTLSTEERFDERILDSVTTGELDRSGNYTPLSETDAAAREMSELRLHYERPETDGAWFLFAAVATGENQVGVASIPRVLFNDAWLRGDPSNVYVRAQYCGIGIANASVSFEGERTIIDLCYEVGEELDALRASFSNGDPANAIIGGMLDIAPEPGSSAP